MKPSFDTVLEMAQTFLLNSFSERLPTLEEIASKVDIVISLNKDWEKEVDRQAIIKILETRFSHWIGRESVLSSEDGHQAWLNAERKVGWRYWPRYKFWLEGRWSPIAVDSLDSTSDTILGLLEDPTRLGSWDRRGLVVGHVQSGKTANYTGLICKAADAGYKIIVVLAGLHKNLRSQTQMRLDEGFLGYETMPNRANPTELRTIGVGLIDSDPSIRPDYVTNRSDGGDFRRSVANNMGVAPGTRPWLFVVKKNSSVLRNLISWVEERVADSRDTVTGHPVVTNLPLLVIDDEADHASVDTGDQDFDENGQADPDYEPKMINRRVRRLLRIFGKSAYVGYTATPFANIFIHEQGATNEEGEDLFPRSFIINLPAPSNYSGPIRIFGLEDGEDGSEGTLPLPLIRRVSDHEESGDVQERRGWMPSKHRNGHRPLVNGIDELPDSLQEAILAFLIACAIRKLRGQDRAHNSMLIHVTRFTNVQREVRRQVHEYVAGIRRRMKRGTATDELSNKLYTLYTQDFRPNTHTVAELTNDSTLLVPDWEQILPQLSLVVDDIHIREINGTARDILDYERYKSSGMNVIAIGGDKLARGLTLEGLTVSYFLRASKMYDTLMQMGRWFGYRPGYLDLCRLYTTSELEEWFQHITEASEELREEFDHMVAVGDTPKEYGLKVKSHPLLMVTSRVKMRNSYELQLSLAGNIQETVVFDHDARILDNNFQSTEMLLNRMGIPHSISPTRERPENRQHNWGNTMLWEKVSSDHILDFLRGYQTHEKAVKVNAQMMAKYIEKQLTVDELTEWTVALMSGEGEAMPCCDFSIRTIRRSRNVRCYPAEEQFRLGRYIIRRLLAPRDEAIDLGMEEYAAALELTIKAYTEDSARSRRKSAPQDPSGPAIRRIRGIGDASMGINGHPERGLLLLYPLSPSTAGISYDKPIIGVGVSFPSSNKAQSVTYRVTNLYWKQEYGGEV